MSRSGIAALLQLICTSSGFSQQQPAINDYLKPIVSGIAADPNVGEWEWRTNFNGGYLLRKLMDVTGDGRRELFLTSTLESTKHEHSWTVFDVAEDGTMRPYNGTVRFASAWPSVEKDQASLAYVAAPNREREQAGEDRAYPVHHVTFAFPEIEDTVSHASEAQVSGIIPADKSSIPKLQGILLADYLTNPQAQWTEVTELKRDANDSYFRVEDKERAEANKTFTPQVALSRIGLVGSASQNVHPSSPAKTKVTIDPPTMNASEGQQLKANSKVPWGAIVALAALGVGFLWLLLSKRRHS